MRKPRRCGSHHASAGELASDIHRVTILPDLCPQAGHNKVWKRVGILPSVELSQKQELAVCSPAPFFCMITQVTEMEQTVVGNLAAHPLCLLVSAGGSHT